MSNASRLKIVAIIPDDFELPATSLRAGGRLFRYGEKNDHATGNTESKN